MYLSLIFLSIIGSCLSGFFGKQLGPYSKFITIICIFISLLNSVFVFYEVALLKSPVYFTLFNWLNLDVLKVNWGFMFDTLTVIMCVVVTFISFLVHLYSHL